MDLTTRFFKFMFGKEYKNLLYLPPEFTRTAQHLVDQETQIEDRNGKQWSVTVSKVNNSLAFGKGWREFFVDHGLEQGDLLYFKYKKESHFFVRIHGKSATERIKFNINKPLQNKRPRRGQVTASEGVPLQTADVNSGVKPTTAASGAIRSEYDTRQINRAVKNADPGGMQHVSVPSIIEDLTCMMNRNDGNYPGEDRNILDLSSFEMQNRTSYPSNFQKALITKLDPSGGAEQTKTMGDDAEIDMVCQSPVKGHSGDFFTEKLENPKLMDEMKGRPGNILNVKSEKAMETEIFAEITKQTIRKEGIQEAVTHSSQTTGRRVDIDTSNFSKKPSENRNTGKRTFDDVSSGRNGGSNIADRVHARNSRFRESRVSSSFIKEPFGSHTINIKKEQMEMENEGKEWNDDPMSSPEVKVELNISPFQAEVISKSYLELPAEFPPIRGRRDVGKGRTVYLRNSIGKAWPVLYPDIRGFKALTTNWRRFCNKNSIKPGDKCRFTHVENVYGWFFQVDVIRNCGESPHK